MELVPQTLATLIRRVERELETTPDRCTFDLPEAKQWHGAPPDLDLSRAFHGDRAATVVGPAAGPHTQLAQNIALSFLAGGRILELKTVQILDTLKIPRPCIDVTNIGFNVEWSQELRVEQSRDEYAKAALLLAALKRLGLPKDLPEADRACLFDLSLGYDLAGIQSEKITRFVEAMLDATPVFERLREELPPAYQDLAPSPRLVDCVTLSTFHGCPAGEIEGIARYLMERFHLHMVVKLNPTLLGFEGVQGILHDTLGYRHLAVRKETFEKDLQWEQALGMIARLRAVAKKEGVTFGVKLTNTLVVDNFKPFFTEKEMYLSGQPLHVLSTQVLARLRGALPLLGAEDEPPVVYSFSAGIDQHNFADAVAADLLPVTVCSDLLRPGGYGRLPKYLSNLAEAMRGAGARDVEGFILRRGDPVAAMSRALPPTLEAWRRFRPVAADVEQRLMQAASRLAATPRATAAEVLEAEGLSGSLASHVILSWVHEAGTTNAARLAAKALSDPRYRQEKNDKAPKKIGSQLALFDCVNCDKCVPVCPNDANFVYEAVPFALRAPVWRLENGALIEAEHVTVDARETHQLATFMDFCNACGNCDVFCPEDGGPYRMKPHWFGGRASFEADPHTDGFYLESREVIVGRIEGAVSRLAVNRDARTARYEDPHVALDLDTAQAHLQLRAHVVHTPKEGHAIRGDRIVIMAALLDGVLRTTNPVSAALV